MGKENLKKAWNDKEFLVTLIKFILVLGILMLMALAAISVIFAVQGITGGDGKSVMAMCLLACCLNASALILLSVVKKKSEKAVA